MITAIAITEEIDDVQIAAEELTEGVLSQIALQKNSCGILYHDYETDGAALSGLLHEKLGIDVIGCSALAVLEGCGGYHDMVALLTVLSADDVAFSVAMSEPMSRENALENATAAYEAAAATLPSAPGLIFSLPPAGTDFLADFYLEDFTKATGGLPIIGGVPSGASACTEFNGQPMDGRLLMILMSGNIRPVFSVANVVSRYSATSVTVTRADGATIYEVDGKPLLDYFVSIGLDREAMLQGPEPVFFKKYPILMEDQASGTSTPYVRMISHMNAEDGSGVTFATVPEGAKLSLGLLQREDVRLSIEEALHALTGKMEAAQREGYSYSTILCITCAARHEILNPQYSLESDTIRPLLPEGLTMSAFYSHGELCPIALDGDGARNRLHNGSVVFCAI